MLGVGGGTAELHTLVLAGLAGLVGGALSMACGEYISVASQRDSEQACPLVCACWQLARPWVRGG